LLKSKAEVSHQIQNFVAMIETRYNLIPKVTISDNGSKFFLSDFYASKGIIHQKSCVETPQENASVERKHTYIKCREIPFVSIKIS